MLAVCNARYEFLLVDIGGSGRQSDGSVYNNSHLGRAIENNLLDIPKPEKLNPDSSKLYPFVFVADDAFGLKPHMMKPYPNQNIRIEQRILNCRLSRARRVIESTFGIATSRFRVFHRPLIAKTEKVKSITKAVVALHNYVMKKRTQNNENNYNYCTTLYIDRDTRLGKTLGNWRKEQANSAGLQQISQVGSNNYSWDAKEVRNDFKNYFCSTEGSLDWKLLRVTRDRA